MLGKQKLRDQHWDFSSGSEAGFLIYGLGLGAFARSGWMVSMWDLQNGWFIIGKSYFKWMSWGYPHFKKPEHVTISIKHVYFVFSNVFQPFKVFRQIQGDLKDHFSVAFFPTNRNSS